MKNLKRNEKDMIRNFIYMDSEKLRSLSSQLFEGVTDAILKAEGRLSGKDDKQKGPLASGQILADIFREERSSTELRFLEDHAYSIFENEISKSDNYLSVEGHEGNIDFQGKSFIRVTGKLEINDTLATNNLISEFNKFGSSLYRVTNQEYINSRLASGKPVNDKEIEKLAKENGMQMDPKFLSATSDLLEFTFKGMMELQISRSGTKFSAPIKRNSLRESEELIVQKFSRRSEADFSIFGLITQVGEKSSPVSSDSNSLEILNLKHAIRGMSDHMLALEESFSGLSDGEVIIDPIAVYQVL